MIALGAARALVTLADACSRMISAPYVDVGAAEVLDARATLEKHAPLIAEAKRIVDAAAAADVVDAAPSPGAKR